MKLKKFFRRLAISIGIIASIILLTLVFFIFKPHKHTVAGIPDGFTERQINIGEVTLNYVEGPDNGTPVLLIPGQMESWQGYKLVMSDLAKSYHVYIVDVRGNGKSGHTPGHYSYNICGNDLSLFLKEVVKKPAIVSGLSSGAVLSAWLGAYAPELVLAVVSEDPPMFSSIWPRITEEKFMAYGFQNLIKNLDDPANKDIRGYFKGMGYPKDGDTTLTYIPENFGNLINFIYETNKKYRPDKQDDPPLLPFRIRLLFKYLSDYDVDFSKATIDGRLSEGFDPEDALKKIRCPMLLMHASWSRNETWGILGAMDDKDADKIKSLVGNLEYVQVESSHDIHCDKPDWWLQTFKNFAGKLK
jgi:pimeloyl-ACP methyl ester carboxylesterase